MNLSSFSNHVLRNSKCRHAYKYGQTPTQDNNYCQGKETLRKISNEFRVFLNIADYYQSIRPLRPVREREIRWQMENSFSFKKAIQDHE